MNLVDQIVLNKVYGEGRVSSQDDKYVYIAFNAGEKKFKYPEAFDIFLRLKDKDKQKCVDAYITRLKMPQIILSTPILAIANGISKNLNISNANIIH